MNNLDRTSTTLLLSLVVGVWGLLLRPFFTPTVVQAQSPPSAPKPASLTAISVTGDNFYLYQEGKLYVYGFEGARRRREEHQKRLKTLVEKGFVDPSVLIESQEYPFESKPNLLSTYNLSVPTRAR